MRHAAWLWAGGALASVWLASAGANAQSLSACGDIDIEASAECEVVPPTLDCDAGCSVDKLELACDAQLRVECTGECDVDVSASCTGSCQAGCEAGCDDLDPGSFDCSASCQADCAGSCEAECEDSECMATCEGYCKASCDAECDVVPPMADCSAKCDASCDGSCDASANIGCRLDCDFQRRGGCQADIEADCHADCETERGALFCDGQYVDHGGNFGQCKDALRDAFQIDVTTRGEASSECMDGHCEAMAEGSATANCSSIGGPTQSSHAILLGVAGLFALGLVRRFG